MPTLADLKAQHRSIRYVLESLEANEPLSASEQAIAALIAKALEDEARIEELTQTRLLYGSEQFALGRKDGQEEQKLLERLKPGSAAMYWHRQLEDFRVEWRGSKGILEAKISNLTHQLSTEREAHEVTRAFLERVCRSAHSYTTGKDELECLSNRLDNVWTATEEADEHLAREAERQREKVPDAD